MPADAGAALARGEDIAVTVAVARNRVAGVRIVGRRPPQIGRLVVGRGAEVAAVMLSRLFTLCAHAQAAALRAAVAAAQGAGMPAAAPAAILTERMMELLRGTLVALAGPSWTGLAPTLRGIGAAGRCFEAPVPPSPAVARSAVAAMAAGLATLGLPAGAFDDAACCRRWLAGEGALPALLRSLADAAAGDPPAADPDALQPQDDAAVAGALTVDPDFARAPGLAGRVPETGPLVRNRAHPVIVATGSGVFARFIARLIEIAETPARLRAMIDDPASDSDVVTAQPLAQRRGLAAVECARGRLYHLVALDGAGRIGRLDMLAPTEWNFHADGPLVRALIGRTLNADAARHRQIDRLIAAFDPCVGYRLNVVEAGNA